MNKALLTAMLLLVPTVIAQTPQPVAATTEVFANFKARLAKVDATDKGALRFVISADGPGGERATIRIPLSGTEPAYGEERSCRVGADGKRELVYTAGLEEANYMSFQAEPEYKDFRFLLNKYLCRLLAAPFHCGGQEVRLDGAWPEWRLGRVAHVDLESTASATLDTTPVKIVVTDVAFDYERCAAVAPSGGFCCVGGHTTEWHCGGTPAGPGWEQVSGECFHRETAVACHDGEPLPVVPRLWP